MWQYKLQNETEQKLASCDLGRLLSQSFLLLEDRFVRGFRKIEAWFLLLG
jgi:hypothetical protein